MSKTLAAYFSASGVTAKLAKTLPAAAVWEKRMQDLRIPAKVRRSWKENDSPQVQAHPN